MNAFYTGAVALACLSAFWSGPANAATQAGNVTAKGSGSCAAITGTFPAFGAEVTINGNIVFTVTLLITPKGGTLQTVEDIFNTNNNTLSSIDSQLFGQTNGTYSGPINTGFGGIILGSNGASTGTPVTLNTPIPGAPACVIQLFGVLYFTG